MFVKLIKVSIFCIFIFLLCFIFLFVYWLFGDYGVFFKFVRI